METHEAMAMGAPVPAREAEVLEEEEEEEEEEDGDGEETSRPSPTRKRRRFYAGCRGSSSDRLVGRLGSILSCASCLDLPKGAVYQCPNGHLMCVGCFTHAAAESALGGRSCPDCRTELSAAAALRNLAAEKAASELPTPCVFCGRDFPRNVLDVHQESYCDARTVACRYARIGCPWRGAHRRLASHEDACPAARRSAADILPALAAVDAAAEARRLADDAVLELLSADSVAFTDLRLRPTAPRRYETRAFAVFGRDWLVKARVNDAGDGDEEAAAEVEGGSGRGRRITYSLVLKTVAAAPIAVSFLVLRGPFGDMKVDPQVHRHEFAAAAETPLLPLPVVSALECDRLLAEKYINFRIVMFSSASPPPPPPAAPATSLSSSSSTSSSSLSSSH